MEEDLDANILSEWKKEEKYGLLMGIREFGSSKVERIKDYVPTKSEMEIHKAIKFYKGKTRTFKDRKSKKMYDIKKDIPKAPLNAWANVIAKHFSFDKLHTETATALRLIAKLEDVPAPKHAGGVNLKKLYLILANALEGKLIPCKDNITLSILNKCVVETAMISKSFLPFDNFREAMNMVNLSEQDIVVPRSTNENELLFLKDLVTQRSYNPLNVPVLYLKSTNESDFMKH